MKTQLISPFCPGSVLRNAIHLSYHFRQFHRTTFVPPFIPPSFYPVFAKPLLFSTFPLFPFFPFISKCPPFPFFPQSRSAREPRSARDRTGARRASEAQQNLPHIFSIHRSLTFFISRKFTITLWKRYDKRRMWYENTSKAVQYRTEAVQLQNR